VFVERSFGSAIGLAGVAALFAGCAAAAQSVQHVSGFAAVKAINEGGARLFVSDSGGNIVTLYGYKSLKRLGAIGPRGVSEPQGMCNDKTSVWLANAGFANLVHFSASGKVLATLSDAGHVPGGCALDEQGDLAVSNFPNAPGAPGSVSIWKNATGNPTNLPLPGGGQAYFVAYDAQGDLFVDGSGVNGVKSGAFVLFELVKGASRFTPIRVAGATINFPGGLQYANNALAIGDQSGPHGYSVIYQTHISGSTATVLGRTDLDDSTDAVQTCITPFGTIIVPDAGNADVEIYRYPAGGTAIHTIVGFDVPVGSALIP
jgi:hypothetical protein